ncbi:MAG: NERD domain-containing protein [Defluviicoccus sp.]|nr:MAG: NERD domain-containing protein [Defluviicoccus sp.]
MVEEGNTIIASQVTAKTSLGNRVIDHLIMTPSGQIMAVEVKSGSAVRSSSQLAKDALLEEGSAKLVGKNAGELNGWSFPIKTIEMRY